MPSPFGPTVAPLILTEDPALLMPISSEVMTIKLFAGNIQPAEALAAQWRRLWHYRDGRVRNIKNAPCEHAR